ncbi:ABC transporter substrate-binding protein [Synechococcus sp. ROS8604]|uniref:substrate-binding periplasmic protein n=1 Tax=Synechococcus sp. ROS8604 TaxID=1442557 RepID=UPI0016459EB2|nr:transporter substrate-binding domain-containing protein [Synechococcus sp. ROS8604]
MANAVLIGCCVFAPAGGLAAPRVLRVGVVEGSQPCSYREGGVWRGLAVDLWTQVAQRENLHYRLIQMPSIQSMLDATRVNELDVAVECINLSPNRLRVYQFSLPFQEDGQAFLVANDPFSLSRAFLAALLSPSLMRMVALLMLLLFVMSALVWWVEDYSSLAKCGRKGPLHRFIKVFTIILTGEGDAEIVDTSRGRAVLMAGYVVRNISSAVLVGFLTVELVQEAQGLASRRLSSFDELSAMRVGYKSGTVSEELLKELGMQLADSSPSSKPGRVPIDSIRQSLVAVKEGRVNGVLADELQLRYLKAHAASSEIIPVLAMSGIRPELQGFALSPDLDPETVKRINLAISQLKRNGLVQQLRNEALAGPGAKSDLSMF